MPPDTFFGFSSMDPEDRQMIDKIAAYKRLRASGIPADLVAKTLKRRVGQIFVLPLVRQMQPAHSYRASELAALLGDGWHARKVAAKLCVLGRLEKAGRRIFDRPADGLYSITPEMRDAIIAAAAA